MATTVADADVAVHADVSPFAKELKKKLTPILKAVTKKIQLGLEADGDGLQRSVDDAVRKVGRRTKSKVKIGVDTDERQSNGFFGRIRNGLSSIVAGAQAAASAVGRGLGQAFSLLQSVAGPAMLAIGAVIFVTLIGVVVTLTGVIAGLAAGLVSMGAIAAAAFGVFAVAGIPTIMKLIKAVQGGNKEIAKLPKGMQGAARQIQGLKRSFDAFLKPLEAPISRLVGRFAVLGQTILPRISPIVTRMTDAFSHFIARVDAGLKGPELSAFFTMLEQRGPRIFENLTSAAGNFGLGLVSLVNQFAPFAESLSKKINNVARSFREWANSVKGKNAVRDFIEWVKTEGKDAFDGVKDFAKDLPGILKKLASDDVKGDIENISAALKGFAKALDAVGKAYRSAKSALDYLKDFDIRGPFRPKDKDKKEKETKNKVVTPKAEPGPALPSGNAFGFNNIDFGPMIAKAQQAAGIVQRGLGLAFTQARTIAGAAITGIVTTISSLVPRAAGAVAGLGSRLAGMGRTALGAMRSAVGFGVTTVVSAVRSVVGGAASAAGPVVSRLGSIGSQAASRMASGIRSGAGAVANAARSLASTAGNALSGLASRAFRSGSSLAEQFASGIRSGIGAVANAVTSLAESAWDRIPHSPVREGPLKVLNQGYAGRQVAKMLADGITAGTPLIDKAMANAVTPVAKTVAPSRNVTTQTTHSPTFNVSSPSADPLQVALAALRQYRPSGVYA